MKTNYDTEKMAPLGKRGGEYEEKDCFPGDCSFKLISPLLPSIFRESQNPFLLPFLQKVCPPAIGSFARLSQFPLSGESRRQEKKCDERGKKLNAKLSAQVSIHDECMNEPSQHNNIQ